MQVRIGFRSLGFAVAGGLLALTNALAAQTSVAALAEAASLLRESAQPDLRGRIQGTVFDSLTMKPMPRASVMLMGTGRSTISDDRGRFSSDSVAAGEHEVGFSAAALDSVGLGVMGTPVTVAANQAVRVTLSTPSFRTFWSNRCNAQNTLGSDSTIVWGSVRDAATDSLLPNIIASFSWYDLRPKKTTALLVDEIRKRVLTDSNGNYFACGVPSDIMVSSQALNTKAASGRIEYVIGARRLFFTDLLVSTDMVVSDTVRLMSRQDSLDAARVRGRSGISGKVVNEKGKPLSDALVVITDVDSAVRTGADGVFRLSALPAGTHTLHVRRVGSAPTTQLVQLRPDVVTDATVHLSDIPTLAVVNVRSEKFKSRDRMGYEARRGFGLGYALDGNALLQRRNVQAVLQYFPGMYVTPKSFGVNVEMRAAGLDGGSCAPTTFLDGVMTDVVVASSFPIEEYRAIEVYNRSVTVPAEYYRFGACGAILFWTKKARW